MRILFDSDKESFGGIMFAASFLMFVITYILFKLLLEINK